jgi:hypothetical protein
MLLPNSLNSIRFPIYRIRKHSKMWNDNNVIHIDTFKGSYILDNRNLPGNFLNRRRSLKGKEAYPLYKPIMTHRQLILDKKHESGHYVDSTGGMFTYNRSRFVPLTYRDILNKEYVDNEIIITAKDLPCKFIVPNTHRNVMGKYLGVLELDGGYMLYNLLKDKRKNSRVKI